MITYDEFQKITRKSDKSSLKKRSLCFGVGINDSEYITGINVNGKRVCCPAYKKWISMLVRSFSDRDKILHPTYTGVTTCSDWLVFSNFRDWVIQWGDFEKLHLDKDIIIPGNKEYHPEKCLLVDKNTNVLFTDRGALRGDLPMGVSIASGRYQASGSNGKGKTVYLGLYGTPVEAERAYREHKHEMIMIAAEKQTDERAKSALINRAKTFKD